jgi:hypothetical protein
MLTEYVDAEYGDDGKEISMFFDVPVKYKKDFELFVTGSYSKFSLPYKDLLVKTYGQGRESGIALNGLPKVSIYDAIFPLKETKKLLAQQLNVDVKEINEVLDPPNLEKEEYKLIEEL